MAPQVDPEQRQADDRELRVPVRPCRRSEKEVGRVDDPLEGQLVEMVREVELEVDDLPPIRQRLRRILTDGAPHREVRHVEAEPDADLKSEMSPATRQDLPAERDDPLHRKGFYCSGRRFS